MNVAETRGLVDFGILTIREDELTALLRTIPNLPHESVPAGADEADNQELRRWGELPEFDFAPLDHTDVGAGLEGLDFDSAVKLSGSRFVVMHRP